MDKKPASKSTGVNKQNPPKGKTTRGEPAKNTVMQQYILAATVLLFTFIAYLPVLRCGFINTWDDPANLLDNPIIRSLDFHSLKLMFTTPVGSGYIPLPLITYAIEYKLFGLSPTAVHATNLALQLFTTLLVLMILQKMGMKPLYAALGALIYGVHPMGVESVAWASERKDMLYAFFYLASVLAYLQYLLKPDRKIRWLTISLALFVLSLLSKIQAVSLPLALLVVDFYMKRPLKAKLFIEKIPYFLLSLGIGIAGVLILQNLGSLRINEFYTLTERLFFGTYTFAAYIVKFIVPFPLSALYPYPVKTGETLPVLYYLSPLFIAALAAGAWWSYRRGRAVAAGLLFFTVNVVFMLQVFGAGQGFMADRFTKIAYVGLILAVASGLQALGEKYPGQQLIIASSFAGIMALFMDYTWQRCGVWTDSGTLWTDVIEKFPGRDARPYGRLGIWYNSTGDFEQAAAMFSTHLRLDPGNAEVLNYRGNVFFTLKKYDSAYADYIHVLRKNSSDAVALGNLGVIYIARNQYDSALIMLDRSLSIDMNQGPAYANRAVVHTALNRPDEAVADFKRYLRVRPDDPDVIFSIGAIYYNRGDYGECLKWFDRAVALNPQQPRFVFMRARAKMLSGDREGAEVDLRRANELGWKEKN